MTSAFVSYGDGDAADFVDFLEALLISWDVDVFRDRNNLGSGPYVKQFEREIPKREFFLIVVSNCAESSDWVEAEVELAFRIGKKHKMVPLKLHSISLNHRLILGMLQYIDFTGFCKSLDVYDATLKLARFLKIKITYAQCRASTDAALANVGRTQNRSVHRLASPSSEKGSYDRLEIDQVRESVPSSGALSGNGAEKPLYKTGQSAPSTGIYKWSMYFDGTVTPLPTSEERSIRLLRGESFPPVHSANKAAYWKRSGWYPRSLDLPHPQSPGEIADKPGEYVERGLRGGEIRESRVVTIDRGERLPPTQRPGRSWERIGPPRRFVGGMALYKTGDKAPRTGVYKWMRYTDGTRTPTPTANERRIPLEVGETFPPVKSAGKAAWWRWAGRR